MSVEFREPGRMPQPEQWLSEHEPWTTIALVLAVFGLPLLIGWLA